MTHSKLDRRAILAGAAAIPADTLPALALPTADPIFAAIERHQIARAAWQASLRATEDGDNRPFAAEMRAVKTLARTKPTTQAGVFALVRYVADLETSGCGITLDYVEKRGEGPMFGDRLWRTLADVMPRLAVVHGSGHD